MLKKADNRLIFGKTSSGKTVKVMNLIEDHRRVLMFDTTGHDYNDGVVFYDIDELKKFWLRVYKNDFRLIYRPLNEIEDFTEICDLTYLCGNMTLVAEELDLFCRPNATPLQVKTILKRGRHRDVRFIGVSQRPFGIDRTITSQANEIYVFHTDEPRDVDYLAERFGSEIRGLLKKLEPYQYVKKIDHDSVFVIGKDEL